MQENHLEFDSVVNELALEQLDSVSGGATLEEVAHLARLTCGPGNVAEVSETGFKCK